MSPDSPHQHGLILKVDYHFESVFVTLEIKDDAVALEKATRRTGVKTALSVEMGSSQVSDGVVLGKNEVDGTRREMAQQLEPQDFRKNSAEL